MTKTQELEAQIAELKARAEAAEAAAIQAKAEAEAAKAAKVSTAKLTRIQLLVKAIQTLGTATYPQIVAKAAELGAAQGTANIEREWKANFRYILDVYVAAGIGTWDGATLVVKAPAEAAA